MGEGIGARQPLGKKGPKVDIPGPVEKRLARGGKNDRKR